MEKRRTKRKYERLIPTHSLSYLRGERKLLIPVDKARAGPTCEQMLKTREECNREKQARIRKRD